MRIAHISSSSVAASPHAVMFPKRKRAASPSSSDRPSNNDAGSPPGKRTRANLLTTAHLVVSLEGSDRPAGTTGATPWSDRPYDVYVQDLARAYLVSSPPQPIFSENARPAFT